MRPIVFHHEAKTDLREAVDYYDGKRTGLGNEFVVEVGHSTARIAESPQLGSIYRNSAVRHVQTDRFPYVIYYLERDSFILVVAVAHGRRRPGYWKSRLRN